MTLCTHGCKFVLLVAASLLLNACGLLPQSAEKKAAASAQEEPKITLELNGVDGPLADNVRAHLSVTNKPCSVSRAYLRVLRERTANEAQEALQAFGHYASRINAEILDGPACPRARIDINPGHPVLLNAVDIDVRGAADSDIEFRAALGAITLRTGDQLNHGDYARAKQLIESVALERGYLEGVYIKHELKVDPKNRRADIALVFDSGPRYAIGEIAINQQPEFLDEELVRRFLEDTSGPYTAGVIGGFHRALSKSSYFNAVDVRPRLSAPTPTSIPIDITLAPRDRHAFKTGIGASTDEGIRGRLGYQNRRLNRHGHQLDVTTNASLIEQQFSMAYRLPRTHPTDEWLSLQGGVRRRDVDTFDTLETQVVIAETKRRPWGWMETRFVELNREDYDVSGTNETATFLAPGISWRRTVANDDLFPTRGHDIDFELKGASDVLLSSTSFVRSLLKVTTVYGLLRDSRVLLRGSFGAMWVDDFKLLPPSERFFAGGDNNLRGYDIDSLGPVDTLDVIGGTYLAVVGFELEHYFSDRWGMATFIDSGNAFGGDGSSTGVQTGIGLGVRWRSPVGPIRLDIAHPLDDPNNDFRIHLRIGPDL